MFQTMHQTTTEDGIEVRVENRGGVYAVIARDADADRTIEARAFDYYAAALRHFHKYTNDRGPKELVI